jgi:hypothetical protein
MKIQRTPLRAAWLGLFLFSCAALGGNAPTPPKGTVPNSKCAECHEQETKTKQSAHVAVPCSGCHLKHEEYPHPENTPKPVCKTCHADSVRRFELSEHAAQIRRGNQLAPDCSSCHGDVHEVKSGRTDEFHRTIPETCGMCHDKVAAEFAAALGLGVRIEIRAGRRAQGIERRYARIFVIPRVVHLAGELQPPAARLANGHETPRQG